MSIIWQPSPQFQDFALVDQSREQQQACKIQAQVFYLLGCNVKVQVEMDKRGYGNKVEVRRASQKLDQFQGAMSVVMEVKGQTRNRYQSGLFRF